MGETFALVPIDNSHSFNSRNRRGNDEYQELSRDEPKTDVIIMLKYVDLKLTKKVLIC